MSDHPSVSVVIPTYNRAEWLPASVGSVLAQTVKPLEILIVDDGSTDNTAEVCAGFPAPVRYIRQTNAGVSVARNRGVQEARGEFVAFLDSDDVWEPEKLNVQLALHHLEPELDWSATGATVIGPDAAPVEGRQGFERVFAVFRGVGLSAEQFFEHWLTRIDVPASGRIWRGWSGDLYAPLFLGNFILPSSAIVRRNLFERIGGFDPAFRLAEETEFFHRLAADAAGAILSDPLTHYRVGLAGSLVSPANVAPLIRNALISGERAAKLRPDRFNSAELAYRAGRRRLLRDLAYAQLSQGETAESRATVRDAWRSGDRSLKTAAIFLAALMPSPLLALLYRIKRQRA